MHRTLLPFVALRIRVLLLLPLLPTLAVSYPAGGNGDSEETNNPQTGLTGARLGGEELVSSLQSLQQNQPIEIGSSQQSLDQESSPPARDSLYSQAASLSQTEPSGRYRTSNSNAFGGLGIQQPGPSSYSPQSGSAPQSLGLGSNPPASSSLLRGQVYPHTQTNTPSQASFGPYEFVTNRIRFGTHPLSDQPATRNTGAEQWES